MQTHWGASWCCRTWGETGKRRSDRRASRPWSRTASSPPSACATALRSHKILAKLGLRTSGDNFRWNRFLLKKNQHSLFLTDLIGRIYWHVRCLTCQLRVEFRSIEQRGQEHDRGAEHGKKQRAEERPRHHAGELMMVILSEKISHSNTEIVSTRLFRISSKDWWSWLWTCQLLNAS